MKRPVRTRAQGVVGAGGFKPLATRLDPSFYQISENMGTPYLFYLSTFFFRSAFRRFMKTRICQIRPRFRPVSIRKLPFHHLLA